MEDEIKFFVFLFLILGGIGGCAYTFGMKMCEGYGEATGRPSKYVKGICYGQIDGVWYSFDEFNQRFNPKRSISEIDLKAH